MSKKKKHKEIIYEESIEGYHKGYEHRNHRTKKTKSKSVNRKKVYIEKEKDREWLDIKRKINIIGNDY